MPITPFAFIDAALDRADALRDDANTLTTLWPHARVVLIDAQGHALGNAQQQLLAPAGAELGEQMPSALFLGLRDTQAWFAAPAEHAQLPAAHPVDLRTAAAHWPAFQSTLFAQARALLHWHARTRHCAACGGVLRYMRAGWEARCDACGSTHYPRTDPAVIMAVSDGERLLLGRQSGWPAHRYSTLAGFVEPGESLEQAITREVLEESAVRVRSSRYLASQPWPFPGSLMLGFIANAEPDPPQANQELEDVRWFTRPQIGEALSERNDGLRLSPAISISRWLIQAWFDRTINAGMFPDPLCSDTF